MSIGPDLEEVFDDLGTRLTIERFGEDPIEEKVDLEINNQASSPFLSQFMLSCTFSYNTQAQPGEVLSDDQGTRYIIASFNPARFENAIIAYEAIIYRCNVYGVLKERDESRSGVHYQANWPVVQDDIYALLTGLPEDRTLSSEKYGEFSSFELNLHLSGNIDVQTGQRFELSNGDKLEILGVEPRRLNNLSICIVRKDSRE